MNKNDRRQLKALDLFAGLGGWSDGLALEGFDVTGVEIESKIAALYKHRVIVSDVCALDPNDFKGYDLIVGSPPCRNFTDWAKLQALRSPEKGNGKCGRWKKPPDPEGEGMKLVNAYLHFVEVAKPTYWLMENVPGLNQYYKEKPRMKCRLTGASMRRLFWGNFPLFLVPRDFHKGLIENERGPLRHWLRSKIPLPVARALGAAVRQAIIDD
jgi:site-specific DNA-cytosine methylase